MIPDLGTREDWNSALIWKWDLFSKKKGHLLSNSHKEGPGSFPYSWICIATYPIYSIFNLFFRYSLEIIFNTYCMLGTWYKWGHNYKTIAILSLLSPQSVEKTIDGTGSHPTIWEALQWEWVQEAGEDPGRALPRPGAQGVPMVEVIKREGVAFKAEWQHLKKSGIKRDRGSLGNWQWFSLHPESVEQRVLGSLLQI